MNWEDEKPDEEENEIGVCPHCFEPVRCPLSPLEGHEQQFVIDCEVCCRPMQVQAVQRSDGSFDVDIRAE